MVNDWKTDINKATIIHLNYIYAKLFNNNNNNYYLNK